MSARLRATRRLRRRSARRRWGHRASVESILASALTALYDWGGMFADQSTARPRRHQPLQEDLRRRARVAYECSLPVTFRGRLWLTIARRGRPDRLRPAGAAASHSAYIRSPDCTRQDMLTQSCTVDAWPTCSASAIMYPGCAANPRRRAAADSWGHVEYMKNFRLRHRARAAMARMAARRSRPSPSSH